jgi:hypothetical protein
MLFFWQMDQGFLHRCLKLLTNVHEKHFQDFSFVFCEELLREADFDSVNLLGSSVYQMTVPPNKGARWFAQRGGEAGAAWLVAAGCWPDQLTAYCLGLSFCDL